MYLTMSIHVVGTSLDSNDKGHVSMLILLRASLSPSSLSAEALESYERDVDENSVVCH
jgi:hypothetical protein